VDCGTERVAYNGCGNRHCPSCLGSKSADWLVEREAELLPVPYFHVVFTVPEEVARLALGNKSVVYGILLRAASETLLELGADPKHLGAQLGFLAILHTWTQKLEHHPHVHCVVPAGGLSPDRSAWLASRSPDFLLPIRVMSRLFRGKFLAYLSKAFADGELDFGGSTKSLSSARAWRRWIHAQRRKEWVVYAKPPFGSPAQVLKYLARYTHRVAISNARLVGMDQRDVRFTWQDRQHGNRRRVMTLSGPAFLRRFLLHVLPRGFVRIRYFGFLANRHRASRVATIRAILAAANGPSTTPPAAPTLPSPTPSSPAEPACAVCGGRRFRPVAEVAPLAHTARRRVSRPGRDTS
jgi:hypothetical protein